jgi:hypothetical protein
MANGDSGFLQKLRMANIFAPGNNMAQPNMNSGMGNPMGEAQGILQLNTDMKDEAINRGIQQMRVQQSFGGRPQLGHIASASATGGGHIPGWEFGQNANQFLKPDGSPMDTRVSYPDDVTPRDRALIDIAGKNNETKQNIASASLGEKARESNVKDVNADQDRNIKQQRANTYDFKTKHPNAQILHPAGGNYMLLDPITHEMHDSGVSTGTMTQEDFQNNLQNNRLQINDQKADSAEKLQGMKGKSALDEIAARSAGALDVANVRSGGNNRPITATQERAGYWNKAQQVLNTNPELSKYIQLGNNGEFNIEQPGTSFFGNPTGPTPDQYKQLNEMIYGKTQSQASPNGNGNSNPKTSKKKDTNSGIKGSKYQGTVTIE